MRSLAVAPFAVAALGLAAREIVAIALADHLAYRDTHERSTTDTL